ASRITPDPSAAPRWVVTSIATTDGRTVLATDSQSGLPSALLATFVLVEGTWTRASLLPAFASSCITRAVPPLARTAASTAAVPTSSQGRTPLRGFGAEPAGCCGPGPGGGWPGPPGVRVPGVPGVPGPPADGPYPGCCPWPDWLPPDWLAAGLAAGFAAGFAAGLAPAGLPPTGLAPTRLSSERAWSGCG